MRSAGDEVGRSGDGVPKCDECAGASPRRFVYARQMRRHLFLSACLASLCGCSDKPTTESLPPPDPPYVPPEEACTAPNLDDPRAFVDCNVGSGIFGTWIRDEDGLPAYFYGLDQNADPRASFFNTEDLDRRDHVFAFGNSRVNAIASNDGYVEVVLQDRGVEFLNKFDPEQGHFAGGFGFVDDGESTFCTAYKWRPRGAKTTRVFGMGYVTETMTHRGLHIERTLFSTPSDTALVIDEVTIENQSDAPKTLKHYEYWDVARRPIEINWLVSGKPFTSAPGGARTTRDGRNELFTETLSYDAAEKRLGLRRAYVGNEPAFPKEQPSAVNHYPDDPFLVALVGEVSDVYTDQETFFGTSGPEKPEAVINRKTGHGTSSGEFVTARAGKGQPNLMAMRSDLTLAPHEKKTLRFGFGATDMGAPFADAIHTTLRDPARNVLAEVKDSLKKNLFYFATDADPFLHREMAWHSSQMEVSVGYRDDWGVHVVPQGSAYLYLHGADGAARDLSLFAVPLVYTHPELAREELALNMQVTHAADHRISYAFQGHGMLDDALGLHKAPSDLDIFFLWAISEYIGATGDTAFLDELMPFHPKEAEPSATVWDHIHQAVRHLFDVVGTGEHGLIRVGTGDWSDGIAVEAPDRKLVLEKGESVPNTQMAVAVLPRVADVVELKDPALAAEIRGKIEPLRQAAASTYGNEFFGRVYFGDGILRYADTINLEAQVWALIGDTFPKVADRATTIAAIRKDLDEPSPGGATLLPKGQVWPAISGLLTWGYAKTNPDLAFEHLAKNTLVGHAQAFPDIWYGIWSAPDGLAGPFGDRPGQTWYSQVTPMTDFPAMNNNAHAMPILAALRACGIDATAAGISLRPPAGKNLSMRTALLDLDLRADHIAGVYRPTGQSNRTLDIELAGGKTAQSATLGGMDFPIVQGASVVTFPIAANAGPDGTSFEVVYTP